MFNTFINECYKKNISAISSEMVVTYSEPWQSQVNRAPDIKVTIIVIIIIFHQIN